MAFRATVYVLSYYSAISYLRIVLVEVGDGTLCGGHLPISREPEELGGGADDDFFERVSVHSCTAKAQRNSRKVVGERRGRKQEACKEQGLGQAGRQALGEQMTLGRH